MGKQVVSRETSSLFRMPVDFIVLRGSRVQAVSNDWDPVFHVKHQPLAFSRRVTCTIEFTPSIGVALGRSTWNVRGDLGNPNLAQNYRST